MKLFVRMYPFAELEAALEENNRVDWHPPGYKSKEFFLTLIKLPTAGIMAMRPEGRNNKSQTTLIKPGYSLVLEGRNICDVHKGEISRI